MLKGLTVAYLLTRSYQVRAGDTVLFHAAAGGVGLLAGQWMKSWRDHHRHRRGGEMRWRAPVAMTMSSITAAVISPPR